VICLCSAAGVRLIVWCKVCQHQIEPDPAETAARYGANTSVLVWRKRLVCSRPAGRYGGDRNEAMIGEKSFAEIAGRAMAKGTETLNGRIFDVLVVQI
jgi:hypothetical protein